MTERRSSFRAEWSEDPESTLRTLDSRLRGNDEGRIRHSEPSGVLLTATSLLPDAPTAYQAYGLGDGSFIHVSSKLGVTRSSLEKGYWRKHFQTARRVLRYR